jgi:phospholipid/cholesterol/gamma-HCH transport system permease protein
MAALDHGHRDQMPFSLISHAKKNVLAVQEYALLASQSLANLFTSPRYIADTIQQGDVIGVGSLPIVILTGFFLGAVLALQSANELSRFGGLSYTGELVSLSMVREIGPVLTGLMVAGRSATGMASELGSMMVTEQIDAMRALGTDPSKKLVTPRVVSTVFMLVVLTVIADLCALVGGYMVAIFKLRLDGNQYWSMAWQSLGSGDIIMGLLKPFVFGFIISTIGCYYGISARGGTQGVGRATTQAMVSASVLLVIVDLFITQLLLSFFPFK